MSKGSPRPIASTSSSCPRRPPAVRGRRCCPGRRRCSGTPGRDARRGSSRRSPVPVRAHEAPVGRGCRVARASPCTSGRTTRSVPASMSSRPRSSAALERRQRPRAAPPGARRTRAGGRARPPARRSRRHGRRGRGAARSRRPRSRRRPGRRRSRRSARCTSTGGTPVSSVRSTSFAPAGFFTRSMTTFFPPAGIRSKRPKAALKSCEPAGDRRRVLPSATSKRGRGDGVVDVVEPRERELDRRAAVRRLQSKARAGEPAKLDVTRRHVERRSLVPAGGTAVVAEMSDVRRRVVVRLAAANAVLGVGRVLERGRACRGSSSPNLSARSRPSASSASTGSSALTTSVVEPGGERRPRASARRRARARRSGRVGLGTGSRATRRAAGCAAIASGSAPSSTSKSPSSAPRARHECGREPGEEVRASPVPGESMLLSKDLRGHRRRRRLAIRRRDEDDSGGELGGQPVDRVRDRASTGAFPGASSRRHGPAALDSVPTVRAAIVSRPSRNPIGGEGSRVGRRKRALECLQKSPERSKLVAAWLERAPQGVPSCASTRRSSPPSAPACAGDTRTTEILEELRAAAERHRAVSDDARVRADPETRVHPQTVIEHFGTWNAAKRAAGLFPRRFLTRAELLEQLRDLGERARSNADRARSLRSPALASVGIAVRAHVRIARGTPCEKRASRCSRARSGSSGPSCRERSSRERSAAFPRWPTGPTRGRRDRELLSEWQVYRLLDVPRGAWTAFQYLVRERLRDERVDVDPTARSRRTRKASTPQAGAVAASTAKRSRQETASAGRGHGCVRTSSSRYRRSGRKRRSRDDLTCDDVGRACPSRTSRSSSRTRSAASTIASARRVDAKKRSARVRPIQRGRATAAREEERRGVALVDPGRGHASAELARARERRCAAAPSARRSPRSRRSCPGSWRVIL